MSNNEEKADLGGARSYFNRGKEISPISDETVRGALELTGAKPVVKAAYGDERAAKEVQQQAGAQPTGTQPTGAQPTTAEAQDIPTGAYGVTQATDPAWQREKEALYGARKVKGAAQTAQKKATDAAVKTLLDSGDYFKAGKDKDGNPIYRMKKQQREAIGADNLMKAGLGSFGGANGMLNDIGSYAADLATGSALRNIGDGSVSVNDFVKDAINTAMGVLRERMNGVAAGKTVDMSSLGDYGLGRMGKTSLMKKVDEILHPPKPTTEGAGTTVDKPKSTATVASNGGAWTHSSGMNFDTGGNIANEVYQLHGDVLSAPTQAWV